MKKSSLNPFYNEALLFDVPASNVNDVSLIIKVIDYDRYVMSFDICHELCQVTGMSWVLEKNSK